MRRSLSLLISALALLGMVAGCGGAEPWPESPPGPRATAADSSELVTLTVIGTNDIHGAIDRMPAFAAYVQSLRQARSEQGGGVLVVDGGDMFQGTLESNLGEGEAVIELMNAIGYHAAAIGNHEFDFGPAGPLATPSGEDDDPRGALKARAKQAEFPLLGANIVEQSSGQIIDWPGAGATALVEVAGVKVGIIGLATVETPETTIAANVVGLKFEPLASAVLRESKTLRERGATVIAVAAHAGGICRDFSSPRKLSSCDPEQEIFELAHALPAGHVDVIIAGHTHRGVAHVVNEIPIIEQYAHSQYFGRVDLAVSKATGRVVQARILPPQKICRGDTGPCLPLERYENRPLSIPENVRDIARKWQDKARIRREEKLGITASTAIERSRTGESLMGNWVADLMLAARPGDVAITNGGGLRADIPAGPITYGELYRVLPFDNRFAIARVKGKELEAIFAANLQHDGGILSVAGVRVVARCVDGKLEVEVIRPDGKAIADDDTLRVVTSDFLATTGREFVPEKRAQEVVIEDDPPIRDAIAAVLRKQKGTIGAGDRAIFDAAHPRVQYPGERPVRCE